MPYFQYCKARPTALILLATTLLLLTFPVANATAPSASVTFDAGPASVANYGGVVMNQTVTVAGNDFYQHFVLAWRDSELSERHVLSVHELPSARWGSRIWIEYQQRRILQINLPVSRAAIKAMGAQAASAVQQQVTDEEVQRLLFREADLGADEI